MSEIDNSVLEAARGGDRSAIAALIREHHRPLRAFSASLMLSPHDADDVAQESFLRALERLDQLNDVTALSGFLRGIARNVVRERRRKSAREENAFTRLAGERFESGDSTEAAERHQRISDPETLQALQSCLDRLSERARDMLTLRYTDELNSDQIGERVELNGAAVRSAMRRARTALLDCLRSRLRWETP